MEKNEQYMPVIPEYLKDKLRQEFDESQLERPLQPAQQLPTATVYEFRKIARLAFPGTMIEAAKKLCELIGENPNTLLTYLTTPSRGKTLNTLAFKLLQKAGEEEQQRIRKGLAYDSRESHYTGQIIYVLGIERFGIVKTIIPQDTSPTTTTLMSHLTIDCHPPYHKQVTLSEERKR